MLTWIKPASSQKPMPSSSSRTSFMNDAIRSGSFSSTNTDSCLTRQRRIRHSLVAPGGHFQRLSNQRNQFIRQVLLGDVIGRPGAKRSHGDFLAAIGCHENHMGLRVLSRESALPARDPRRRAEQGP